MSLEVTFIKSDKCVGIPHAFKQVARYLDLSQYLALWKLWQTHCVFTDYVGGTCVKACEELLL